MTSDLFEGLPMLQEAQPDYPKTGLVRDIFIAPDHIMAASQRLLDAGYHLEDLSGLDTTEGMVANYHFDHFEQPGRIVLRVLAPLDAPSIPSIAGIFTGAEWHERELTDFYGVAFEGNPNPVPLLLPADDACTPLVKSEKARVSISELINFDSIVHRTPGFDLTPPPGNPEPENKEAPN